MRSFASAFVSVCLFLSLSAHAVDELVMLSADDGIAGDGLGDSVAVSGDLLIAGASFADIGANETEGAAYVFEVDPNGDWAQVAKITAPDGVEFDQFGFAVALESDTAVIGAKGSPVGPNSSQGAAYVFRHAPGDTTSWSLVKKLTATTQIGNIAEYGTAVDISGDSIIVGSQKGGTGSTGGLAFIYDRDAGGADNWGEVKLLVDDVFDNNANFGVAVAIDGDTAVVGASFLDQQQFNNEGGFYVYHRDEGGADQWGQTNRIYATATRGSARFGRGIDIEGNTIAVGSWNYGTDQLSGTGRVYLFDNATGTPGDWTEVTSVDTPVLESTAFFGQSLALVGTTVVAGAAGRLNRQGEAHAFEKDTGGLFNWGLIESYTASDGEDTDSLGFSVAATEDHIALGAPGNGAGAVYVYAGPGGGSITDSDDDSIGDDVDNCTFAPNPAQIDVDGDGFGNACDADLNNDCVVNFVDLGILRSVFFTPDTLADFNGDGVVNFVDLGAMRAAFFAAPGPSAVGLGCP
jgi:hypothetical protein